MGKEAISRRPGLWGCDQRHRQAAPVLAAPPRFVSSAPYCFDPPVGFHNESMALGPALTARAYEELPLMLKRVFAGASNFA